MEESYIFKQYLLIQRMRLKLNGTSNPKGSTLHHSSSKSPFKYQTVNHNMQTIRSKLDNGLASTFFKLNNEKCSSNNLSKPNKEIMINLKRKTNLSANSQYNKPPLVCHQEQLSLINNADVMEYIKLIYEHYNIKDPLGKQRVEHMQISQSTIQKDKAKIGHRLDQLQTARTAKVYAQSQIQVSQFDASQQSSRNTIKRNNKLVITLRSKTAKKQYKDKANPLLPPKDCNKKTKQANEEQQDDQFPLFRYCFACEEPIYEKGILIHEKKCSRLKQAYKLSTQKVLSAVEEKIERLKGDIKRQILQVDVKQVGQRYRQLQRSIHKWIGSVPSKLSVDKKEYDIKYLKVQQTIHLHDNLQLINRLNWFIRLRENLISHYHL